MSCDACTDLVDIRDLSWPYTVKTCAACGRKIKQRRLGAHGIGIQRDAEDEFVIPREFIAVSANPLKSTGTLSRPGIIWFAKLVFDVDLASQARREILPEVFEALFGANEKVLRESELLKQFPLLGKIT